MKNNKKVTYSLFSVKSAIAIFVSVAYAVIYLVEIFLHTTIVYRNNDLSISNWTLGIIVYATLCTVFTAILLIYRKFTVKNPILRILRATEKIGAGDFSVRLPIKHKNRLKNEYDVISENINSMAQQLASIETLRQDFVSNVSHEFKAPLSIIQNCCTILSEDELTEEDRKKYAEDVSLATKRLTSMITNILKLSNLESQNITPVNREINLAEHLREEILVFESLWNKKNIDINFEADDSIITNGDRELMSLLWTNLLSNAFKFTPENGAVTVSVIPDGKKIRVDISDTGPGIDEDKLPRVFEKFYQCDTSHVTNGNGLGLPLVKSICDLCGYEIIVKNNADKGCTCSVILFNSKI